MFRRVVHWSLAVISIVLVVSGLGITQYRVVQPATLGLLDKALAFQLHTTVWIPFLVLLGLHVALVYAGRRRSGHPRADRSMSGHFDQ